MSFDVFFNVFLVLVML